MRDSTSRVEEADIAFDRVAAACDKDLPGIIRVTTTGEADLAIRAGEPQDESLARLKIADVPWAIYASKPHIDLHGAPASGAI